GYRNLCKLVSLGFTEGFYYKPRIDYEILKTYNSGLIALTSTLKGDIPSTFINQGADAALAKIQFYKEIFGDRFYLEVQRNGERNWENIISFYKDVSRTLGIPIVATNDVHYIGREESFAQEILLCIQAGKTLMDDSRPKLPTDQFYFKT